MTRRQATRRGAREPDSGGPPHRRRGADRSHSRRLPSSDTTARVDGDLGRALSSVWKTGRQIAADVVRRGGHRREQNSPGPRPKRFAPLHGTRVAPRQRGTGEHEHRASCDEVNLFRLDDQGERKIEQGHHRQAAGDRGTERPRGDDERIAMRPPRDHQAASAPGRERPAAGRWSRQLGEDSDRSFEQVARRVRSSSAGHAGPADAAQHGVTHREQASPQRLLRPRRTTSEEAPGATIGSTTPAPARRADRGLEHHAVFLDEQDRRERRAAVVRPSSRRGRPRQSTR